MSELREIERALGKRLLAPTVDAGQGAITATLLNEIRSALQRAGAAPTKIEDFQR